MTYTSIVETSLHDCLKQVCGDNAAEPCNDVEEELKCFLLIQFLARVEASDATSGRRREQLQRSTTDGAHAGLIEAAADNGFTAGQAGQLECPACKVQARMEDAASLLFKHAPSCPYPHLCTRSVSRELLDRDHVKPLLQHLAAEWSSTKREVALELGFHPCLVLIAVARCYLQHRRKLRNAGELVEVLVDMEEGERRPPVWNVTPIVKTFELQKEKPPASHHAVPVCNPTRIEGEASGQKVQRPVISENSPQGSLETPRPPSPTETKSNRETLLEETMRLVYRWRCKSCGKTDADQLLASCGHLSLCSGCLRNRTSCPICDFPITETVRVYVS